MRVHTEQPLSPLRPPEVYMRECLQDITACTHRIKVPGASTYDDTSGYCSPVAIRVAWRGRRMASSAVETMQMPRMQV